MITLNFPSDAEFAPEVERFPAKNFSAKDALLACGDGYEIRLNDSCALVLDEHQFDELLEAMIMAAPKAEEYEADDGDDDKGQEWKGGGA